MITLLQLNGPDDMLSEQVFSKGVDKDTVLLMAARASRLENQDAIDTAIVSMLADPKEVFHFPSHFQPLVSNIADEFYPQLNLFLQGTCWNHRSAFPSIQSNRQENCSDLHR